MTLDCYDLDGNPITFDRWCMLTEERSRPRSDEADPWWRIGWTVIPPFTVSTVWLGLNYNFLGEPPLIFETMVFAERGPRVWLDSLARRYPTKEAALAGHDQVVAEVRAAAADLRDAAASLGEQS